MTEKRKQIGWLIIGEGEKGTLHYETASWYKELLLDVGKHPLFATFEEGHSDAKDTSIHAAVMGTVLSDAFPSSFGGHIFSSNLNEHIGERDTWHYTPYAHALESGLLDGSISKDKIELLDNFRAVYKPFVYQGRHNITYDIIELEEE